MLVSMGDELSHETNDRVLSLFHQLETMRLPGIRDLVPAFNTLAIILDSAYFDREAPASDPLDLVRHWIEQALRSEAVSTSVPEQICVEIPVWYDHPDTPDLPYLSDLLRLSPDEIIHLHAAVTYRVFMLGFLPGFPYLGLLDERLASPRLARPRMRVPAGSIAIAGRQTGIYPLESPGGWNLVGKTSVRLYDPAGLRPTLLRPGDTVRFIPVSEI